MVSRIVLLTLFLSLMLAPFAGLAPLMLLGLILGVFSIVESIVHIIWTTPTLVAKDQESQSNP
ncbi:MAG: hypothetical protein WBB29_08100 [Geitlerinemataceae cyanobacterium]